ncbi:MAG: hypothetical protein ABR532_07035 [Candidatus Dormibacteria bacterium]
MLRRFPVWIVAMGLAGVVAGHSLAYVLSVPNPEARAALLQSGHSYWNTAVLAGALLQLLAVVAVVTRHLRSGMAGDPKPLPRFPQLAGRMAVLQMGTFGILEIGERLLARVPVAGMVHHRLFPIGLAVQLVVACAGALLLRWLARAAETLGIRLRHKPLPAPPRRLSPYRPLDLVVCSPLCDSSRGRAPPSASAPAS